MKLKIFIVCVLCVYGVTMLKAQEQTVDFAGISFLSSKIKDGDISGNRQSVNGFINFPIAANSSNFIAGRANYSYNHYDNVSSFFDNNLTGLNLNVHWRKKYDDKHAFAISFDLGAYSDFKDISTNDFRFRLASAYNIKHSERLTYGFGIAYMKQFTAHQIKPFIYIEYQISNKWMLSGLLPFKTKLTYKINDKLNWVNELYADTETYRLSEKTHNNSVVEVSGWHGLSGFNYTVGKHHRFTLGLGYSANQQMRYFDNVNSKDFKLFIFDLSNKNKPISEINLNGARLMIGYNLIF